MKFSYNRDKAELLRVMKSKAEKKNIRITESGDKLTASLEAGKFSNGEDAIPVTFKGAFNEDEKQCSLQGKFTYGFNLYTMVIVAAILIVARFSWSAYQKQVENMILCGIVTVLLIIVMVVVNIKAKSAKQILTEFLEDLNVK